MQPDRSEERTAHRSAATVAEHEQVRATGHLDQHGSWRTGRGLDRHRYDGELRTSAPHLLKLQASRCAHSRGDLLGRWHGQDGVAGPFPPQR